MNLLIVNDEILTAEVLKEEIDWKFYGVGRVFTAYDAESGKQCIRENKIDIMLCDIEMPGENGIALLRWVRERQMEMECIFLTCHANFEYAKEAIELGCQNYLLIPAKDEEIGEQVRKVVDRIQEKREAQRLQTYGKQLLKVKLDQMSESHEETRSPKDLVEDAMRYILEQLGEETLTVNEVAEHLYVHPVYLNRIFKKEKEISVGKYIIEERMKYAGKLLRVKRLSASVVAEKVGYASYANFNLMFKRYYGCTPAQYQEEER